MNLVNWLCLQPTEAEFTSAIKALQGVTHLRTLLQALVRTILQGHPWQERDDLIPLFDPTQRYTVGDYVALPLHDEQALRPDTWRIGRVTAVVEGHNPVQGAFQVVTVEVDGRGRRYAAGLPQGRPLRLAFPPQDPEDLEWLVGDIVDTYDQPLTAVVQQAVEDGHLDVVLLNDRVLRGDLLVPFDGEMQRLIAAAFAALPGAGRLYLTTDELLRRLREAGHLSDVPDDVARFSLAFHLRDAGYHLLGGDRWISATYLEALNRRVARRPRVPVVRSRVARERGEDDTPEFSAYEEVALAQEAQEVLEALGEEEAPESEPAVLTPDAWRRRAPSGPVPMPTLTYQQIIEGLFPLTSKLAAAFPPGEDPLLVDVQIIEGEPIPCLVSRAERLIKAVDPEGFRRRFLEAGIPAGTKLWLERRGDWAYRIAPRPLSRPQAVCCKLVWIEEGELRFAETEIEMRYEGDAHLFKAELRFEDVDALFREAEESGLSIFDALWYTFPELAQLDPEGKVHYTELFNAVFFRHRMCSPRSVVTELYTRPCFVPVGGGYFRFEPQRGIRRKPTRRRARRPPPRPARHRIVAPPRRRIRRTVTRRPRPRPMSRPTDKALEQLADRLHLSSYIIANYLLRIAQLHRDGFAQAAVEQQLLAAVAELDPRVPFGAYGNPDHSNQRRLQGRFDKWAVFEDDVPYLRQMQVGDVDDVLAFWQTRLAESPEAVERLCEALQPGVYTPGSDTGISDKHFRRIEALARCGPAGRWVAQERWIQAIQLREPDTRTLGGSMCEHFLIPFGLVERDRKVRGRKHRYRLTWLGAWLVEHAP